jgi:hypothetical protein
MFCALYQIKKKKKKKYVFLFHVLGLGGKKNCTKILLKKFIDLENLVLLNKRYKN